MKGDKMDLIKELCDEMNQLKENGLALNIRTLQTAQGPWLEIENKKVAANYRQKIGGFNDKKELELFLLEEPKVEYGTELIL